MSCLKGETHIPYNTSTSCFGSSSLDTSFIQVWRSLKLLKKTLYEEVFDKTLMKKYKEYIFEAPLTFLVYIS